MKYLALIYLIFGLTDILHSYEVKGRVVIDSKPVNGAYINVYDQNMNVVLDSVKTNESGYFTLNLEEGTYFFRASYAEKNKKYVGYSGKNPVYIFQDDYIGIKLLPFYDLKIKKSKSGRSKIKGEVIFEGKPLKNAIVYFYLSGKDIKGMPYIYTMPTNKNGFFEINDILPGRYFLVARKKRSEAYFGPIDEGDFIGFFQQNPINIEKGKIYFVKIPVFKKVQDDIPNQVKASFKITGYALDESGKPVAGVYAFAYKNKEMGHERPVSISKKTKDDGYFELFIPERGVYYLGVRQFYGGTPVQGELYGLYEETYDHHIYVENDVKDIKITLRKILK